MGLFSGLRNLQKSGRFDEMLMGLSQARAMAQGDHDTAASIGSRLSSMQLAREEAIRARDAEDGRMQALGAVMGPDGRPMFAKEVIPHLSPEFAARAMLENDWARRFGGSGSAAFPSAANGNGPDPMSGSSAARAPSQGMAPPIGMVRPDRDGRMRRYGGGDHMDENSWQVVEDQTPDSVGRRGFIGPL